MTSLKESLTSKILSKEIVNKSQAALDLVRYYSKVSDIIERTHIAMGKKKSFKIANSSTQNQKLNTNVYSSTN